MYIRTKDGVYEVEGRKFYDALKRKHYITTKGLAIKEDDIIKQSENLEDLCDEFVGLITSRSSDFIITRVLAHSLKELKDILKIAHSLKELKDSLKAEFNGKTYQSKFDIIYGCIWTGKGLIYVAKMDNEGKLVLI